MDIITTKALSYKYNTDQYALDNVDISIKQGKVTAILGGNGAGKSTLFLTLNGVLTPTSGEVYFEGEKMSYNKKSIMELRKRVGIVFQDPNDQLFSADVRSDISFGAVNLGLSDIEVKVAVEQAAMQTGITEYIDKPTHALSFGQKKRVAIAGVLAMKPEVIILDEPTAGLDPSGVGEILQLLLKLQKERSLTILLSTHDIDLVPLYCDYAYVLEHGKVAMSGTSDEIFSNPQSIRNHSLRLPRIGHLMEILSKKDHLPIDNSACTICTISKARKSIKAMVNTDE